MFIGSTDDGHTFVTLNAPIPGARQALAEAGFTARSHHGRTLYLFPPGPTTAEAHEKAGVALYGLLAHTLDFADLAWTTRQPSSGPEQAAVRITFAGEQVTATARTSAGRDILTRHGFLTTGDILTLPPGLSERDRVGAVVRLESHLYTEGITVHVALGFPTVDAIPPKPGPEPAPVPAPGCTAKPRTR
ncbi:hypothetical protein ACFRI7_11875 [Streptomyces sp. NPDC056716]|uniref:hypothetical protein n=1 Tax=unclassified Streptomyces TaxID=2593676 RepID=UPI00368EB97E